MKSSIVIIVVGFIALFISDMLQLTNHDLSTSISVFGGFAIYIGLVSIFAHLAIPD
jgi:ABC-type Na+ efflux pump permease subunit